MFKGLLVMALYLRTYTVDEVIEYLDENFDILNNCLNSDIEGFEDNKSDNDQGDFMMKKK